MANGDELMLSRFTVSGPLITGGHPLQVPDLFIEPGSADFYRGYFGMTSITGLQLGTINIGMNPTSPFALFGAPGSNHLLNACLLNVFGDSNFTGNLRVFGGEFRTTVAAATIKAGVIGIFGPKINITGKATNISGALINIAAPGLFIGGREWYSSTKSWDSKKGFDIPHPTKQNHRLRYICVEGPTADVHFRGKSTSNIIELPDYWKDLVDLDSITVSLTPIGCYQELYVDRIEWGKRIVIKNNTGNSFNYQYTVFAERIDGEKNIPEYEGLTPADYPGDNSEYRINSN